VPGPAAARDAVREDFDRLALLGAGASRHNDRHLSRLLRHLPAPCGHALDVGCGTGILSRLMARRCERVLGLDLSPNMIRLARERSSGYANIDFEVADAMERSLPQGHFDCIASVATLHHLPLAGALERLKRALRPGGVLLVLDLFAPEGWRERLTGAVAATVAPALRLMREGRLRQPRELREAWARHARLDDLPRLVSIREIGARVLPGARIRRHLLWRYSLVWARSARPSESPRR
jgi:ubiquinone/menaquinone biosynthesis C-methylase UbiE